MRHQPLIPPKYNLSKNSYKLALEHGFSNCGMHTTTGTPTTG